MKRAALYLRVSTNDQSFENQREPLARMAAMRGFDVAHVFEETCSARRRRPEFDRLMEEARRGSIDVILIWAIDRLGRSTASNLATIAELDRLGVRVVSHQETWMDSTGPFNVRELLIAIFSWVAQQERERRGQRTRAGLERGRQSGKQLGRPKARIDLRHARQLLGEGHSIRTTARMLRVSEATLRRTMTDEPGRCVKKGMGKTAPQVGDPPGAE